jgi:bifunctional DNase/RNase
MKQEFTDNIKDFIRQARDVAAALRTGYISTLHFFLAGCMDEEDAVGVRAFIFPDKARFKQYYDALMAIQQYYCPDYLDPGDLPLLKEAERAMMEAFIEKRKYGHPEILPAHFFLAATRDAGSVLNRALHPKDDLYDRLVAYYIQSGLIAYPHPPAEEDQLNPGFARKLNQLLETANANPASLPLRLELRRMDGEMPGDFSLQLEGDTKTPLFIENLQQKESEPGVYAVQFGEEGGKRKLLLELSAFEAQALSVELEQLSTGRPRTHRLLYDVCMNVDYQLQEVILSAHDNKNIMAQAHFIKGNKILIQEMCTPDAIIMAAMSHAPVFIAEKVFRMFAFIPS